MTSESADEEESPAGEATARAAPPSATGGGGFDYERDHQARCIVDMLAGDPPADFDRDALIVEMRFQASGLGIGTDDLVLTLQDELRQRRTVYLQCKSNLRATAGDPDFRKTIAAAWRDFGAAERFVRERDEIVLVYRDSEGPSMRAMEAICGLARENATIDDFETRARGPASSKAKKAALEDIRKLLTEASKRDVSREDVWAFLRHWRPLRSEGPAPNSIRSINRIIGLTSGTSAADVWARLKEACAVFNRGATINCDSVARHLRPTVVEAFRRVRESGLGASSLAAAGPMADQASGTVLVVEQTSAATGSVSLPSPLQPIPSPALGDVLNRFVSGELDAVDLDIKAGRVERALAALNRIGADQSAFEPHQQARWRLMRANCYWAQELNADAAKEFLKAHELYPNDARMTAARLRGLVLSGQLPQAKVEAAAAVERFPESAYVWIAWAAVKVEIEEPVWIDDFPPSRREDPGAWQVVAISQGQQGKWPRALEAVDAILGRQSAGVYERHAALATALDHATREPVNLVVGIDPEASARLARCVEAFSPREQRLWGHEAKAVREAIAGNLGSALLVLERHGELRQLIEEARSHGVTSERLLHFEIELLDATEDDAAFSSRSLALVEQIGTEEVLLGLIQAAANRGDVAVAQAGRQRHAAVQKSRQTGVEEADALLWVAMSNAKPPQDLRQAIDLQKLTTSNCALAVMVALRCYGDMPKKPKNLRAALMRRARELSVGAAADIRLTYADVLLEAGEHAQAAEIYGGILPKGRHTVHHVRWLKALIGSGQAAAAKDLLDSLPDSWLEDPRLLTLAASLGERAGDLELLQKVAAAQVERAPQLASCWLFRYAVDRQLLPLAQLRDRLAEVPLKATGGVHNLTMLASEEMRLGLVDEGVQRLYRMRRQRMGSAEAAAALVTAMIMTPASTGTLMAAPDVVGPGCSILLREESAGVLRVSIDPAECGDLPATDEFKSVSSSAVRGLLGRRVGEPVAIDQALGAPRTMEIVAIESSYARLVQHAHESLERSIEKVPGFGFFRVLTPEGELDTSAMEDQMRRRQARVTKVLEQYEAHPVTLLTLAEVLGMQTSEMVVAWHELGDRYPLQVCEGTVEEKEAAYETLASATGWVVDAATLTELSLHGVGHALDSIPAIHVAASTEASLLGVARQAHENKAVGRTGLVDGRLRVHQISDTERARTQQATTSVVELMQRHAKVAPAYGPRSAEESTRKLLQCLATEDRQVLELALQHNFAVLSLDGRLRAMAKLLGLRGAWPVVLLEHAVGLAFVSQEELARASGEMALRNRTFVPLSADALFGLCMRGRSWLRAGMSHYASMLVRPDVEYRSSMVVLIRFLDRCASSGCFTMGALASLFAYLHSAALRHPQSSEQATQAFLRALAKVNTPNPLSRFPYGPIAGRAKERDALSQEALVESWNEALALRKEKDVLTSEPPPLCVYMVGREPLVALDDQPLRVENELVVA